jgi:hypothetical protein
MSKNEDNGPKLVDGSLMRDYSVPIRYPANIEELRGEIGRTAGLLPAALYGAGLVTLGTPFGWPLVMAGGINTFMGWLGGYDADVANFAKSLKYATASQHARINLNVIAQALKRTSGTVDVVLRLKVLSTVDLHVEDDKHTVLYQDTVGFVIAPTAAAKDHWALNTRGVAPENEIPTISYTAQHTWSANAGIQIGGGTGGSGGGEASFTTATETAVPEFRIHGGVAQDSGGYAWGARMQLAYTDGVKPHVYNTETPNDIAVHGAFTRWFKDPPAVAAGSSLPLTLLATFTSRSTGQDPLKNARFTFRIPQRVMYGHVAGRTGAPGAKIGGSVVMVPALAMVTGELVFDFDTDQTEKKVRIENAEMRFSTITDGLPKS